MKMPTFTGLVLLLCLMLLLLPPLPGKMTPSQAQIDAGAVANAKPESSIAGRSDPAARSFPPPLPEKLEGQVASFPESYLRLCPLILYNYPPEPEPPNQPPYAPSNPAPHDGAVGVPLSLILTWTGGDPDGEL